MEIAEAIKIIRLNWPDGHFTRLREALTLIINVAESQEPATQKQVACAKERIKYLGLDVNNYKLSTITQNEMIQLLGNLQQEIESIE